jgi:3-keto-disaccharide hydrolase
MLRGTELMSRFLGVLLGVVCVAYPELGASAQNTATTIDIGKDGSGVAPTEFDLSQGRWTIVRDATAKAGLALEQSGVPTAEGRFTLAIYKTASIKNVEVNLRFKADGGESDRGGGVAVRLSSPQDYYLVRVDALRERVLFSRVSGGATEEIVGVDADIASHSWHTLTVRAVDNEFTVSLDDSWVFTGFDRTFSQPGRIALWTKGDSVTRFDSIAITALSVSEERY